jgi:phage-related protein
MVPFNYILSLVGTVANQIVKNIQSVREFINKLRARILKLIQDLFGVILNIIITFQKIIISMRDLMNKLVGVFATVLYIMQGALYTVKSMWAGVAGVLVRSLGSS